MAIRKVRITGDPILRKISRPVDNINENILTLLDDMYSTMKEKEGVGLAAVQVGALRRVVVIQMEDQEDVLELINPEIIALEGVIEEIEGCLSVPSEAGVVPRSEKVTVKYQNREGDWLEIEGEGRLAICLSHELDHLDGILFTDKVMYMVDEEGNPIGEDDFDMDFEEEIDSELDIDKDVE